jgi:hypothetical protein
MDEPDHLRGSGLTCGRGDVTTVPVRGTCWAYWRASRSPRTATTRVFAQGGWKAIPVWFVICVILHDGVGWPIYASADRVLTRRARLGATGGGPGVTWINHVRVPTVISGLLFVMFAPMIFRLSNSSFEGITGFSENVHLWN